MVFTINDFLLIAGFQLVYLLVLFYLTKKECSRRPKTSLLWLLIGVDVVYAGLLCWFVYYITTYTPAMDAILVKWKWLLLSILVPGLLILTAFSIYHLQQDIKNKKEAVQQ